MLVVLPFRGGLVATAIISVAVDVGAAFFKVLTSLGSIL